MYHVQERGDRSLSKNRRRFSVEFKCQVALEVVTIRISMHGRGRVLDNVYIERLWRTVKYENIYVVDYASVPDLEMGLHAYFRFYNQERLHQSLDYRAPAEVHCV